MVNFRGKGHFFVQVYEQSVRMVGFKGFDDCGCGGTHVTRTGELGAITIRKIKGKGVVTKISYEVV